MTLQFPLLSPVSFPATEKNKSSIIKMPLYKNVVGKASDYNFSTSKPFSFKFHDDTAFSQSKTAQKYFPNGISVDVIANGVNAFVDFVEDSSHIYSIYKSKSIFSGVYTVKLYKVSKSEILRLSPTFTVQTIYEGTCDFESLYHRHMAQDDDYVYVIINAHTDLAKLFVLKIKKSDVTSITSINISTADTTYTGVFDIEQDSTSLYIAGRRTVASNDMGFILQITKSPFAFGLAKTIASTKLGYNLSTLVCPEDNVIFASGSGGDLNYGTMFKNNGTAIKVESTVLISFVSDDNAFLTSCNDAEYSSKRAYVCTEDGGRRYIKGFDTIKGLSGKGSFYCYDDGRNFEAIDVADFVLSVELNYANKSADSEDILEIDTGSGRLHLYMDNAGVITLDYDIGTPVVIAQGSEPVFLTQYTTAQAKQTLRIYIAREAGVVTMKLNDVDCVVSDSSPMVIPFRNMVCALGADFADGDDAPEFRSINFYSKGKKIIDQDYQLGGLPSQQSGIVYDTTLVSKHVAFYKFDEKPISAGNRVNCTANMVYFDSCEALDVIRIGRYNTSDGTLIRSEELNGFGLPSTASKVTGSKYGFVYFLSSMNISAGITAFNISQINIINEFGTEKFSFSCNRQDAEFKFAPSTVGVYQDTLVMTGQNFSFDGICYEPDFAYLAKCPIIKMGEGHADMLRFNSTPSVISIDYYSKAESGYAGTKYIYDSHNANFIVNTIGKYKKVTKSLPIQSVAEVFESWLDTINLFYDWSDGKLVKDSPVDIYCVMGISAMRMEIYTALDTNYNFNDEGDPHRCGSNPETSLLSNTNVFVTGAKQIEVIDTRLDSRNARSIKFRIKAETGSKYDSFKIFEIRYSPTDAFYIGGDYENA
ncbi:MAG TPA: hypothetical protein PLB16_05740 [bacterium]|nr:hypothetical protein [bacterium]